MQQGDGWRLGHRSGLDEVRGIAVLLVVLGHTVHRWDAGGAGRIGVVVFFVLSGFLITRLLLEERASTGGIALLAFYGRRARRLLPALVVFIPLAAWVNHELGVWIAAPVIGTLTYTANYASTENGVAWGAFTHLWSLSVEEHFYFFWPAIVLVLNRRRLAILCVVGIVLVAVGRHLTNDFDPALAFRGTHLRVDAMLFGALLALGIARLRRPPRVLVLAAVGVLVVGCQGRRLDQLVDWGFVVVAASATVLIADALWWRTRHTWLAHVGVVSYGLYLFHLPIALWIGMQHPPEWVLPVATLAASMLLAEVSYRCIERPIRDRGRRGRDRALAGDGPGEAAAASEPG